MTSNQKPIQSEDALVATSPAGGVSEGTASHGSGQGAEVRRVPSRTLFLRDREIEIDHNGALYRLRQTAMGKLILTK